jgi:hypothetical protein
MSELEEEREVRANDEADHDGLDFGTEIDDGGMDDADADDADEDESEDDEPGGYGNAGVDELEADED